MQTKPDVNALRADTPGCAEKIHLNNAGASLQPRPVLEAVHRHLELETRLGGYEAADAREPEIRQAYASIIALRLSPHYYNTEDELRQTVEVLRQAK